MIIAELPLHGAYQIDQEIHKDDRGFFARLFCQQELSAYGLDVNIVQVNNSQSVEKGTLRGLHFQRPPKTENKIVRCLRGAIWDVIVDLRKDSPTVGQWTALELSESNRTMMYVPEAPSPCFLNSLSLNETLPLLVYSKSPFLSKKSFNGFDVCLFICFHFSSLMFWFCYDVANYFLIF